MIKKYFWLIIFFVVPTINTVIIRNNSSRALLASAYSDTSNDGKQIPAKDIRILSVLNKDLKSVKIRLRNNEKYSLKHTVVKQINKKDDIMKEDSIINFPEDFEEYSDEKTDDLDTE